MQAFLISTGVVAIGEIGDKTQLLALMLAARFRKPWPIIAGIVVATLLNHALAGLVGQLVRTLLTPEVLRWVLGGAFLAVAIWALFPDKLDEKDASTHSRWGVFFVTASTFFLAEIGDKTQVATMMLAARFPDLFAVVAGTTLGMLLADVPAVFIGHLAAPKISMRVVRVVAASLFAALGVAALMGFGLPG
jgi:putative Ca2+/H+ antiporter (TMEM165/GDT1 family)